MRWGRDSGLAAGAAGNAESHAARTRPRRTPPRPSRPSTRKVIGRDQYAALVKEFSATQQGFWPRPGR